MPKKLTPRGKGAQPPKAQPAPKTAKKTTRKPAAKKADGADYIRNLWHTQVRISLSEANDERKFELHPRGQRGDLARVSQDEWEDEKMDKTLVELISGPDARIIMDGQLRNQQAAHPALQALRNAHDQPYAEPPKTEIPFEQQGVTVATFEQGPSQSPHVDSSETLTRSSGQPPQQAAVPGSIQNPLPPGVTPEQYADFLARQGARSTEAGATQAAEQLRDSLNVTVTPVQRDITPGR